MRFPFLFTRHGVALALTTSAFLAGCGPAAQPSGVNDPLEPMNRGIHSVNKGLDSVLLRPGAKAYGFVPEPVRQGVNNVADTLDLPGDMANHLLQGRIGEATTNFLRFGVNVVFGLGGVMDVATAAGMPRDSTDFGETLHVWGIGEGPYVEMPGFGPSTARDAVGTVVDLVMNPVSRATSGDAATAATAAKLLARLNDRARYSNTFDSILYDSADSYAQARLLYLQSRRFELTRGGAASADGAAEDEGFIDPYEDQ
ncbi:VacJ family lipoprotein [Xinfangfangia sp. CPCC 101601]|uniref:VacJ family lipoprotein n=1 Tax=Pseudogemmobacter lacusdianii TaxID=3069608 RepID=A0ABU0W0A5_9RHOB|nr:VacJ family lipoprotein [Xinfangfangia sp. CPCC 101601]MDQ2066865.1 VacJ family lipoprotein [Xinfangfangia sp. CPCC 101601]